MEQEQNVIEVIREMIFQKVSWKVYILTAILMLGVIANLSYGYVTQEEPLNLTITMYETTAPVYSAIPSTDGARIIEVEPATTRVVNLSGYEE